MDDNKNVFSIHFPGKKVYVGSTFNTLEEKIEQIKKDKGHILYPFFNPEIREEGYKDSVSEKEVVRKYYKDWHTILNVNVLPYNYKKNT